MRKRDGTKSKEQQELPAPKPQTPGVALDGSTGTGQIVGGDAGPIDVSMRTDLTVDGAEEPPLEKKPYIDLDAAVMGAGYEAIVTRLFDLPEPEQVYESVIAALQLADRASRLDYGSCADALDKAQEMARQAFQLYVNARVAQERLEISAKVVISAMRDQAVAVLQSEKDDGKRAKQITDKDVEAVMAAKFPDEFVELEIRRLKARKMVEAMENLHERASNRARNLDTLTQGARK
jgi:hypothetical protein